jgi:hypothetical protein
VTAAAAGIGYNVKQQQWMVVFIISMLLFQYVGCETGGHLATPCKKTAPSPHRCLRRVWSVHHSVRRHCLRPTGSGCAGACCRVLGCHHVRLPAIGNPAAPTASHSRACRVGRLAAVPISMKMKPGPYLAYSMSGCVVATCKAASFQDLAT